jgi:hypothetical protein
VSFLADPPLLVCTGAAIERWAPDDRVARAAKTTVLGVFVGTSVALYLDARWTRPMWRLLRADSGRDWMLNSGVFRFDTKRAGPRTHAVAAGLFATYPAWLALGAWLGRRRRQLR